MVTGNSPRGENQSRQLIDGIEKPKEDNTARTDHHRATQAGTNRTYIKAADAIVAKGREDLVSARSGDLSRIFASDSQSFTVLRDTPISLAYLV